MLTRRRWILVALSHTGLLLVGIQIAGCSGKPSGPEVSTSSSGTRAASDERSGGAGKKSKNDDVGDGIPLNVWYDDPYSESQKAGTVAVAANTPDAAPAAGKVEAATAAPAAAPAAAGGEAGWKDLISAEAIESEVKQIRLSINAGLQGVSQYNAHYKDIQVDASVLAALAGIAIAHPDAVKWKEKAKFIRDLASDLEGKASGLGAKPFEESKKAFENIDQLLNGNDPPDLGEAAAEVDFSEVAKRSGLMKRMDRAYAWMKSNISTEDAMKKEAEKIASEAAILATLAKVVGTNGYASADEEEYQGFVKRMLDANRDVVKAAQEGNFKAYGDANSKSQKACDECHVGYRFADGG